MPKYSYECDKCGCTLKVLRPSAPAPFACKSCWGSLDLAGPLRKGQMQRVVSSPTTNLVEVLDNGLMTRRVERPANAEALYKERNKAAEAEKTKL